MKSRSRTAPLRGPLGAPLCAFVALAGLATCLGATGCTVDAIQLRVADANSVGVVSDEHNTWLLPPRSPARATLDSPDSAPAAASPAQPVKVFENFAVTATLSRAASGAPQYVSQHWALGTRVDTTPLMDEQGGSGWVRWIASASDSAWLFDAVRRGGMVRVRRIVTVTETGPLGMCFDEPFHNCASSPAVPMSLATESRNVESIEVVRTPIKSLGIAEIIFGAVGLSIGATIGAVVLPVQNSDAKTLALGLGGVCMLLGGAVLGNGLWRLLKPEERWVYRAPK